VGHDADVADLAQVGEHVLCHRGLLRMGVEVGGRGAYPAG
jgi:hypothetical protein